MIRTIRSSVYVENNFFKVMFCILVIFLNVCILFNFVMIVCVLFNGFEFLSCFVK